MRDIVISFLCSIIFVIFLRILRISSPACVLILRIPANALKSEFLKDGNELTLFKDKFSKQRILQEEVKQLANTILDLLTEEGSVTEQTVSNEIENKEIYSDYFISLTRQFNEKFKISDGFEIEAMPDDLLSVTGNKMKSYKLNKIEMKKFVIEIINGLPFWFKFQKFQEDTNLHDIDKFSYFI